HAGHPAQVDTRWCMLGKRQCHHRKVPGVLRRVLRPVETGTRENRLPEHALQPASLGDEPHLLIEPVHDARSGYCGPRPSRCSTISSATKPRSIPTIFATDSNLARRAPGAGRLAPLPPTSLSRRRRNGPRAPCLGDFTGLRNCLAFAVARQPERWPGRRCAACLARSSAEGSRYLAAPAEPEVRSRNWRSKSSGPGIDGPCSVDM